VDQFGNVVSTDNTSSVTVAPVTGTFTTGSTTVATLSSGIATFSNLIFAAAGTFTLSASESGLPGGNGTSNSIVIS
jgi:hypothetical protein